MTTSIKRPEIRSSLYQHDMSGWCAEKSSNVLQYAARMLDLLNKSTMEERTKEDFRLHLESIAWDASKLVGFAMGAEWTPDDARAVQSRGYEGYQEVAVRFGILGQTDEQRDKQHELTRINTFIAKVEPLVKGEKAPNRTFIHELLERTTLKHPLVSLIEDKIEQVTMNDLKWEEFQKIALKEIAATKTQLEPQ
jgi:hypothetical protein